MLKRNFRRPFICLRHHHDRHLKVGSRLLPGLYRLMSAWSYWFSWNLMLSCRTVTHGNRLVIYWIAPLPAITWLMDPECFDPFHHMGQRSAFLVLVLHVWVKPSVGVKPKLSKVSLVADFKATSMMFDVSYLYSKGNVSLVSRLILDAGLTAELVKVWSEQTMWVPQCVPVL